MLSYNLSIKNQAFTCSCFIIWEFLFSQFHMLNFGLDAFAFDLKHPTLADWQLFLKQLHFQDFKGRSDVKHHPCQQICS